MTKELLTRCIEPIQEHLDDLKNQRATYEGYAQRQKRYDRLIEDDEKLLADLNAAITAAEPRAPQTDENGRPMTYWGGKANEPGDEREAALQDIAYRNGAQQALVIAHQSLEAADKWLAGLWERCREARAVLNR